jgi:hypothetical protein
MLYLLGLVFLIAYLHMRRSPSHSRGGGGGIRDFLELICLIVFLLILLLLLLLPFLLLLSFNLHGKVSINYIYMIRKVMIVI